VSRKIGFYTGQKTDDFGLRLLLKITISKLQKEKVKLT